MSFRITGLDPAEFRPLFDLDDAALAARNARHARADVPYAAPCRVSLDDAEPGEELVLLNYEHQPAASPFRSAGPIFVRREAAERWDRVGEIPPAIARRPISARGYDSDGMMLEGQLVDGGEVAPLIERWFENPAVEVIHLHYAKRGCFAAVATRA
jgi:hypothetical protein